MNDKLFVFLFTFIPVSHQKWQMMATIDSPLNDQRKPYFTQIVNKIKGFVVPLSEQKTWLILVKFIHPWTLVIYQGLIYLLVEVKLAASTEPPGHFLSTNFRQQVSWVLLFNFCFHGLLDSQYFFSNNQKNKIEIFY